MEKAGNLILMRTILILIVVFIFGKKNSFTDNQNIFISGMTNSENHTIKWEITKL